MSKKDTLFLVKFAQEANIATGEPVTREVTLTLEHLGDWMLRRVREKPTLVLSMREVK